MIPNKALGQHFITNEKVISRIIEILNPLNSETYIEIGPGKGEFTLPLSKRIKKLVAIEKDTNLVSYLKKIIKTSFTENIQLVNSDILDLKISDYISEPYSVFGSLPYNKSKEIIEKFLLQTNPRPKTLSFIVQKEVSQKYLLQTPKLNYFSALAQLTSRPKRNFDISPGSFTPSPQVDSVLIEFNLKSNINKYEKITEFLSIIFKQPRKTIRNNLSNSINVSKSFISLIPREITNKRASELTILEVENMLLLYNKSR